VSKHKLIGFAFGSLAVTSLAMAVAVLVAPSASAARSAASRYGVINGTVNAATVHEIAGSSAFPNFTTGAVDNYYSMAHSEVDNSPSAEGTASPADTGPIGQTVAAGNFAQPQYADARWPGKDSGKASFGNNGGPYAVANASSYKATAQCSEASNGSPSAANMALPKGISRRLHTALAAWKAKWLGPLHLNLPGIGVPKKPKVPVTVPTPTVPTPTVPTPPISTPTVTVPSVPKPSFVSEKSSPKQQSSGDGGALLESATLATVDPSSGDVVTQGESSLGRVSLGNGQIVIRGIDVSVAVTNNGKPTDKIAVDVGAASIGGVPVTIDQNGVSVQGTGSNLPFAQADSSLNGALKQAGIQLHTVAPEIQKKSNELTITASGVHVGFKQPVDAPGFPSQYVDHILGEVFVDSLATPAGPAPKLGNLGLAGGAGSAVGGTGLGSGSSGFQSGGGPSSSYSSQPGSSGSAAQAAPASSLLGPLTNKPTWLLAGFLVWQALMIGTGLSLRQWWTGGAS